MLAVLPLVLAARPLPAWTPGPPPGLLSWHAAVALGAACGMLGLLQASPGRYHRRPAMACLLVVACVGLLAMTGKLVGFAQLFDLRTFGDMPTVLAAAMVVLTLGLWLAHDARVVGAAGAGLMTVERRVALRVLAVLSAVAVGTGLASFALMRQHVERSLAEVSELSARTNAMAISNALRSSLALPRALAARPGLAQAMAQAAGTSAPAGAVAVFADLAALAQGADVAGIRFVSAQGSVLHEAGAFPGSHPAAHVTPLAVEDLTVELRWADGYVLRSHAQVRQPGRVLGSLMLEQRLPTLDGLLSEMRQGDDTSDALLCGLVAHAAHCAPTRLYEAVVPIPMLDDAGKPTLPINRALLGHAGAAIVLDLRGQPVVAGYAPVPGFRLGLVVKSDVSTLYAPLRQRLALELLLIALLVMTGTWLLMSRARPLLRQLVEQQRFTQSILETSSDAFISIDVDGRVADWNRAATDLFGWTADEARGQTLSELIVPPAYREAHDRGLARFVTSGTGPLVGTRTETVALRRDGSQLPVEMSMSGVQTQQGFMANAFLRDISARRRVQQQLERSEQRVRAIADNLPVMITYIDRDERLRFVNRTFEKWAGVPADQALDRRLGEVIGAQAYADRAAHLQRALAGERVRFDLPATAEGRQRILHTVYVPDRGDTGDIVGIYTLTTDVTEAREAEERLTRWAMRDSLTGLWNRRRFNEELALALERHAGSGVGMAPMFVDVDRFKQINDTHGHAAGDDVLKALAGRLQQVVGEGDLVARIAGDEFVVLLKDCSEARQADVVAGRMVEAARATVPVGSAASIQPSLSIGVAHLPPSVAVDAQDLLARADKALYLAKQRGRDQYALVQVG